MWWSFCPAGRSITCTRPTGSQIPTIFWGTWRGDRSNTSHGNRARLFPPHIWQVPGPGPGPRAPRPGPGPRRMSEQPLLEGPPVKPGHRYRGATNLLEAGLPGCSRLPTAPPGWQAGDGNNNVRGAQRGAAEGPGPGASGPSAWARGPGTRLRAQGPRPRARAPSPGPGALALGPGPQCPRFCSHPWPGAPGGSGGREPPGRPASKNPPAQIPLG